MPSPRPHLTTLQREVLATAARLVAAGNIPVTLSDIRAAMDGVPEPAQLQAAAYQLRELGLLRTAKPTVQLAAGAADALPAYLRPGKATPEPAAPSRPAAIQPAADRLSDHRGAALVDLTAALGLATAPATWDDALARVRELTDDLAAARISAKAADEDAAACRAALAELDGIIDSLNGTLDSVGAPAGPSPRARILALVAARDLREQAQADLSAAALARERASAGLAELRAAEIAAVLQADPSATWPALVERVRRLCWSIAGARAALGGAA